MPLIMGILAQGEAAAPAAAASYDLLETEILTGSQASVTFSSLNATYGADYQHLQIRMTSRTSRNTSQSEGLNYQFNSDSGSNYAWHRLYGQGSSVASSGLASQTSGRMPSTAQATSGANIFGATVLDILDPFETSKYTTTRVLGGNVIGGGVFEIGLYSSVWMNTAALTSITITTVTGSNLVADSRFSLYGLKAA